MKMIQLTIQYNGASFSGYELQVNKTTVRQEIEKALQAIFGKKIGLKTVSRTDSGVSAVDNKVYFSVATNIPIQKIPFALNSVLPYGLRVTKAQNITKNPVPKAKEYEYLVFNGLILDPLYLPFVWQIKFPLDIKQMKVAAKLLQGKHNFKAFSHKLGQAKDHNKHIHQISIRTRKLVLWQNSQLSVISFKFKGDGFLYKMIRILVGTLVDVGLGKIDQHNMNNILNSKQRKLAGRTAPAHGLCLIKVHS